MDVSGQNRTDCRRGWKHREGGFTLVEVMIVVAIIGITTMIAVPSYMQWLTRYQLREATTEITSQLNLARMAAMNRNMAVRLNLATAGTVAMVTTNTAGTVAVLSPVTFPASVTGARDAATPDTNPAPPPVNIIFTSLGLLQGAGSSPLPVRVMNRDGLTYSVAVTGGGKVSWCATATCP